MCCSNLESLLEVCSPSIPRKINSLLFSMYVLFVGGGIDNVLFVSCMSWLVSWMLLRMFEVSLSILVFAHFSGSAPSRLGFPTLVRNRPSSMRGRLHSCQSAVPPSAFLVVIRYNEAQASSSSVHLARLSYTAMPIHPSHYSVHAQSTRRIFSQDCLIILVDRVQEWLQSPCAILSLTLPKSSLTGMKTTLRSSSSLFNRSISQL